MDNFQRKSNFKFLLIGLQFLCSGVIFGQNIISDSKGISSLSLNLQFSDASKDEEVKKATAEKIPFNLGMVKFATVDKKVELNYYGYFTPKLTNLYVGISASNEIKNSVANIFSTYNIVNQGEVNIKLGFRLFSNKIKWDEKLKRAKTREERQPILDSLPPASDLWLIINAGFTGSSFKLFYPDSIFSKQIAKENFTGFKIISGLNYWNARILGSTFLAGATLGIERTNNFDDLDESSWEDTQAFADTATKTTRKIITKQTVYSGKYKELTAYPLNFDIYFAPHKLKSISFLVYTRTKIIQNDLPKTKVGIGVFFLKGYNAFNPVVGITIDYADAFNTDRTDDYKGEMNKIQIGITTRINIVNAQMK